MNRVLVTVVALGVSGGGCKNKGSADAEAPLAISKLTVRDRSPADERLAHFGAKEVEARLRARIQKEAALTIAKKAGAYRLEVEFGVGPQRQAEKIAALVSMRLLAEAHDGMPLEASLVAPLEQKIAKQQHLERTLDAACDDLFWQARMLRSAPADLVAALQQEKDPQRLATLIPIVAERRLDAAVPRLIALLSHSERPVVDRAIGALATLKDRRAVKPLTKLATLRDSRRLAQVIDAVAAVGGPEAISFLDFLAGGHADPTIRNLAREARARMQRATKGPP